MKLLDITNFNNFWMWAELADVDGTIKAPYALPGTMPSIATLQELFIAYPEEFQRARNCALENSTMLDLAITGDITMEQLLDSEVGTLRLRYYLKFFRDILDSDIFITLNR